MNDIFLEQLLFLSKINVATASMHVLLSNSHRQVVTYVHMNYGLLILKLWLETFSPFQKVFDGGMN